MEYRNFDELIRKAQDISRRRHGIVARAEDKYVLEAINQHCRNFDVLILPNMTTGNLLGKSLTISARSQMAGIVVGARIPIVVTSRASSAEEKLNSIALSAIAAESTLSGGDNHE
ncbi:MAG: hypothetical protein LBJ36_10195 [Synergistaceae bacterium]|jgi:phosphotransacetylase|nr:hypothetical protein [Synergistaceae bacterium]